jgi:hypothetical protein
LTKKRKSHPNFQRRLHILVNFNSLRGTVDAIRSVPGSAIRAIRLMFQSWMAVVGSEG